MLLLRRQNDITMKKYNWIFLSFYRFKLAFIELLLRSMMATRARNHLWKNKNLMAREIGGHVADNLSKKTTKNRLKSFVHAKKRIKN